MPAVPQQGSLGASGDLAPLANLALPLIGHGGVLTPEGGVEPADAAIARAGLEPLVLEAKEGLSLVNGTQGMLAIGIIATERAEDARSHRRRGGGDDDRGRPSAPTGPSTSGCRRFVRTRGRSASAANLRRLLAGSPILASHRDSHAPGAGRLLAALRPPGARRHPRRARLRVRGAGHRGQQRERQPDRAARRRRRRRRGRGGRELPRPAGRRGARHRGDRARVAGLDLRAPPLPVARRAPVQRAAALPGARRRVELGLHAGAVHGGLARERVASRSRTRHRSTRSPRAPGRRTT